MGDRDWQAFPLGYFGEADGVKAEVNPWHAAALAVVARAVAAEIRAQASPRPPVLPTSPTRPPPPHRPGHQPSQAEKLDIYRAFEAQRAAFEATLPADERRRRQQRRGQVPAPSMRVAGAALEADFREFLEQTYGDRTCLWW